MSPFSVNRKGYSLPLTFILLSVDLAIANISITSEREKIMDFSQPIYDSGLQILVPKGGGANFMKIIWDSGLIMVGGNINHLTRVMTTAIALETSKGDLALALALGLILIALSLAVNGGVMALNLTAKRYAYG